MFPKIVLIDNFNGCNLKCSICDHKNMTRQTKKMPWNIYTKIIHEVAQESPGSRVWQIYFGDPFLCDDMPGRIAYAKAMGLTDVVLNTNGALMTPEKSKAFINAGLDFIYVGIDAYHKSTYDKIRIGGDFEKVISNVLRYRDMNENIFVQFVECEENKYEKGLFVNFWKARGVKVKIRPMVSWIGLVDNGSEPHVNDKDCYWYRNSFSILNTGDVSLCACDLHGRYNIGEIRTKTIKEVWETHQSKKPETCRTCNDCEVGNAEYHL